VYARTVQTDTLGYDDEFFSNWRNNIDPSISVDVLTQYVQSNSNETACLRTRPELKQLFIQLNTPRPASAASERLFSCTDIVMNSMTDTLFEQLVLLKKNKVMIQQAVMNCDEQFPSCVCFGRLTLIN